MSKVEISVRSRLNQIAEDLQKIARASKDVEKGMSEGSKKIGKTQQTQIKKTEEYLGNLRRLGATTMKEMAEDFEALFSLQGIDLGLKLTDQFKDNIKQTVTLSDTVRRLGNVFGLSKDKFVGFQTALTKGLGDIGLSSESASRSLEGLSKTQVRGQGNLIEYAQIAGQLSETAGEKEGEANISQGLAAVLTSRGVDPNDMKQVRSLAEDLRRGFNATGMSATSILSEMDEMYASMSEDFRKVISGRAAVSLATIRQVAGPQSTSFLMEYLQKSPLMRRAWDARGFKGVVGSQGLDVEKFRVAAKGIIGQFQGDPRLMAQTLGLSEDAAEGFLRLNANLERVDKAQKDIANSTGNLTSQYRASLSAADAFQASLNKTKSILAGPLSWAVQTGTDALAGASETKAGALAVSSGSAILAAFLGGGGLKSIMSTARGGAMAKGYEALTGEHVVPVNVVNASEISGGTTTALSKLSDVVSKLTLLTAVGSSSYAAADWLMNPDNPMTKWANENIPGYAAGNQAIESGVSSTVDAAGTAFGYLMQVLRKGSEMASDAMSGRPTSQMRGAPPQQPAQSSSTVNHVVTVRTAPNLKATVKTNRGATP